MRIINQKGIVDMPYECTILNIENDAVTAITGYGERILFAKYSTPEKAHNAMKKLHEVYSGSFVMENVEITEELLKKMKEDIINAPLMIMANDCENQKVRIDELNNLVFRFPQDEEV